MNDCYRTFGGRCKTFSLSLAALQGVAASPQAEQTHKGEADEEDRQRSNSACGLRELGAWGSVGGHGNRHG